jgi:hypothetical protein
MREILQDFELRFRYPVVFTRGVEAENIDRETLMKCFDLLIGVGGAGDPLPPLD